MTRRGLPESLFLRALAIVQAADSHIDGLSPAAGCIPSEQALCDKDSSDVRLLHA